MEEELRKYDIRNLENEDSENRDWVVEDYQSSLINFLDPNFPIFNLNLLTYPSYFTLACRSRLTFSFNMSGLE